MSALNALNVVWYSFDTCNYFSDTTEFVKNKTTQDLIIAFMEARYVSYKKVSKFGITTAQYLAKICDCAISDLTLIANMPVDKQEFDRMKIRINELESQISQVRVVINRD